MTEDRIGKEISGSMHRRFPSRKRGPIQYGWVLFSNSCQRKVVCEMFTSRPQRLSMSVSLSSNTLPGKDRGLSAGTLFLQNGGAVVEELVVRILGVGDDGTLGVEAESHLIVLEAAVHGVDPGGAVGQHAGFPAGNSTACQVQLAITASAVTSAAMCRNFFCSGLGAFCRVQGLILRAQWGQKDAPSGRGTLQSGQRFCFSEVILDSFIFKMPPSDEERFYTAWRG